MPEPPTSDRPAASDSRRRRVDAQANAACRRSIYVGLRRAARWCVCLGAIATLSATLSAGAVRAHSLSAGDSGVGIGILLLLVAVGSTGCGLLAVGGRHADHRLLSGFLAGVSGPLFVALGGLTLVVASSQQPAVGLAGGLAGLVAAVALAGRVSDIGCGKLAVSAIVLHRFVEGVALSVVVGLAPAVSVLGVGVLTAHASAESIALGSRSGVRPRRAAGSVVLAAAGLLVGAALGSAGLLVIPPTGQRWIAAIVGGLLFALGLVETHGHVVTRVGWPGVARS